MAESVSTGPLSSSSPSSVPLGATWLGDGRLALRVWGPHHSRAAVVLDGTTTQLKRDAEGFWTGEVAGRPGSRYGYLLGDDEKVYADPASRWQPDGPHGLSAVVDPSAFSWTDAAWQGVTADDAVLYELHLGTFTPEGTAAAALPHLEALADLGITVLQVMPLNEFPGRFGWGYDGVGLFAPCRLYGEPDDIRRLVDRAHALGMAVILDVVYNHIGPDGNYLRAFARDYFTDRYDNEWGDALNFDGPGSGPVREWVLGNVAMWVREYHVDGFRLDATQQIFDASPEHLVAAIARTARETARPRRVLITAENEPQHACIVEPTAGGGYGLDGIYNEDFHHSARMHLVGTHEAYLSDYRGVASEWLACAKWGVLYQGQHYAWQKQARGSAGLHLTGTSHVNFLENHDQVANTDRGRRLVDLARPSDLRAMTALLFLLPGQPMLFQGQEFGSRAPFFYFADHAAPLCHDVAKGRRTFLEQFVRLRDDEVFARHPEPHDEKGWQVCHLDHDDDERAREWRRLHRDAIDLRRHRPRHDGAYHLDGTAPDPTLLLLRYFGDDDRDWLIVLNAGHDRDIAALSEPLLAPPRRRTWQVRFSTEHPQYGGQGRMAWAEGAWPVPGHSLLVLDAGQETSPA